MARVIIVSDDYVFHKIIDITNEHGPWTDDDTLYEIADTINEALRTEEDET